MRKQVVSNQFQNPKFKQLQAKWYKKLAKAGFEDQEEFDSPKEMLKRWHGSWFKSRMIPDQFKAKETYFQNVTWFLEQHCFDTSLQKRIWAGHADGLSLSEIAKKLKISRSKAFLVIKRLKEVLNGIEG